MTRTDLETEGLDRLLQLVVVLNADLAQRLAADGLTESRAHVLWVLQQHGPQTQRALADALRVTPRNITGLIDGLVSTGFVTRESHPHDRRATLVSFTEQGRRTAAALEQEQHQFTGILFGGMPRAKVEAFVDTLGDILGRLQEQGLSL